jgi:hypothetical protein
MSTLNQVTDEGEEAGEAETRVDVAFEDVEGEVIEAAEAPDGEQQESTGSKCGVVDHEEDTGKESEEQEE